MENNLMTFKAAVAAFFTALGAFLGWQGIMIVVWLIAMLFDYLSGTAAAMKSGQWCSTTARNGLWHKGGMILVVLVAGAADLIMCIICDHLPLEMTWPVLILPLVLAWYILTELGSILENAVKMGAPIPAWLIKILKVGVNVVDRKGEAVSIDMDIAETEPEEAPVENTEQETESNTYSAELNKKE